MPRRTLGSLRIDALEKLFDDKRSNAAVLTTLLGELSHRSRARARKLRERVIRALSLSTSEPPKRSGASKPPDPFQPPDDEASVFILTPAQHRRVAEIYRNGGQDWTDEERAYAAKLAEHHEMVAKGIERRSGRRA